MTLAQKFFRTIFGEKQKTKYIVFNCSALLVFILIVVFYLIQVNTGISYRLEMEKTNKEIRSLKIENEELLKQTTVVGSMANVHQLAQGLKMVKVDQTDYLFMSEEVFARK
ncbi:MAG: hypothetical protein PHW15_00130 [Patescibacteria group bacterium]|jgi:hypothetical protein|nr:hypothetical protein [Patescibacteria group bacterium]MDD5172667.1 hypothetical protein [Patescibacteria group bacterium]